MNNKKICLSIVIATACISTANAQLFFDDFERADVAQTTNSTLIGNGWAYPSATGTWGINDGTLVSDRTDAGAPLAWNTGTVLSNTATLTYSVDVFTSTSTNGWIGMTFNQHSQSNYDVVRFKTGLAGDDYQAFRTTAGKVGPVTKGNSTFAGNSNLNFESNTWYTITATTNVGGVMGDVSFTITETGSSTALNTVTSASFGADPVDWTNNYFGVTTGTSGDMTAFDNFTVVPEPSQASMLIGFIAGGMVLLGRRRFRT